MKNKKLISTMLAVSLGLVSLTGCSSEVDDEKNVTIWASGSDNVRVQFEQQIENFNEINEEGYVAKLEFITSGTGTQSLADRLIAA